MMFEVIKLGSAQIVGGREDQQDAIGFSDVSDSNFVRRAGMVAVVADGIGGHAFGREASQLAVNEFLREYMAKSEETSISDALYQALQAANGAVSKFAETNGQTKNCGTTLVAAALHPESLSLYWISGGDSRLYLLRHNQWLQLTADCNYAVRLVKMISQGTMNPEKASRESNPQALTTFLGMKKLEEIDWSIRPFKVHEGDWFVLCTDGVYNTLEDGAIIDCLHGEPQDACNKLMQALAEKNVKNQDNASAAIFTLELKDDCDLEPEHVDVLKDSPEKKKANWKNLSKLLWRKSG